MGLSPRDMDFIALKQMAAREIALGLGVPPLLLGIPGDNTYANYAEANRTFWRQTVIPIAQRLAQGLSRWLLVGDAAGFELRFVTSMISTR
jgi:HK97 family phage portal protein